MRKKAITLTAANASFEDQLRLALKHLHSPNWLGQHSPLAAPYFLLSLRKLSVQDWDSTLKRGEALQAALIENAQALWGSAVPRDGVLALATRQRDDSDAYHALILDLNYVHTFAPAPLLRRYAHEIPQSVIYNDVLHISRASHDRHLQAAVQRLAQQVLSRAHPALHEEPVSAPTVLIHRDEDLGRCVAALRAGQSVNIVGATGVGKTALGAAIAQHWARGPVCWVTFRPGLNTHLHSLLMMLAHFLQRHLASAHPAAGSSALWAQWVANGATARDDKHAAALALALLQDDLATLKRNGQTPLLCFDDADVLLQADAECERVRAFLDALRSLNTAPMLLMGQRAVMSADVDCGLGNLSKPHAQALLQTFGATTDEPTLTRTHDATGGNPRLLGLLRQAGATVSEALAQLPARPSLPLLLGRALARLPANQQNIVKTLAVFSKPAPLDLFGAQQEIVKQLAVQGWLEMRESHSVGLASVVRELVAKSLSPQQQQYLHGFAAQTFAARGEATLAASHYVDAGEYEAAILIWLPQAEREMQCGNAGLAQAVFARIPVARLSKSFADQLATIQARLHRAQGQPNELVALVVPLREEPLTDFLQQLGWAHEQLGQLEPALEAYARSQRTVEKLMGKTVSLAASRARLALRQRDMGAAKQEAVRAAYEAERVQGIVSDEAGEPDAAQAHFLRALAHAEALSDLNAIALTCNSLGVVAGRRGDGAAAGVWLTRAAQGFEELGNRLQAEIVRSNLTALLTSSGQHAEAVRVGAQALAFFQKMGHAQFIASTAASLAESCVALGDFDAAQHYAHLVIAQEETQFVPYGLYTLGDVKQAEGNLPEARDLFQRSLEMARGNKDVYMQAYALRKLGQVGVALGETEAGHTQLEMARELFVAQGMLREAEMTLAAR